MKYVFIYAYDRINLGDDLFIRILVNRYQNVQFFIWTGKENRQTFGELKNLRIIDKNSAIISAAEKCRASFPPRIKEHYEKKCDAVVYIGGSIFIEYDPGWQNMLNWWNYEAKKSKLYILGANFGPYSKEEYREGMNEAFLNMQDVCFRDAYSKKLFLGNTVVRWAPDIIFNYQIKNVTVKKKQLFISVINCAEKGEGKEKLRNYGKNYLSGISNLIKAYTARKWRIVLASFCRSEGDEDAVNIILDMLPEDVAGQCETIFYNGLNTNEVIKLLAESEYVIASRFHAVVLAIAAERPVYPVVYSDKTIHMLEDIGFSGGWLDIRTNPEYSYEHSTENLTENLKLNIEELSRHSEEHFIKLDQVLKKEN